jgi:hypothetical protein
MYLYVAWFCVYAAVYWRSIRKCVSTWPLWDLKFFTGDILNSGHTCTFCLLAGVVDKGLVSLYLDVQRIRTEFGAENSAPHERKQAKQKQVQCKHLGYIPQTKWQGNRLHYMLIPSKVDINLVSLSLHLLPWIAWIALQRAPSVWRARASKHTDAFPK